MDQLDLGIPGLVDAVEVGRGGFGVVFRAHDTQFDRDVAVKVLTVNDVSDEQQRRRFDRERRVLGRLSEHPNIVSIFSAGVTADRRPYLVLPYLPGGSVAERLAVHGRLPAAEAFRMGRSVADALAFAHQMGVLHLDVKPANVLIDRFEHHLLADFGIARLVQASTAMLTGSVSATPVYAAPEILDQGEPSPASDVYSLGAMLYTVVTGRTAYEQREGEGLLTFLARVATTEPTPLGPDVDPVLREVITACMARSPQDRPTASEVASRLDAGIDAADPITVDVTGGGAPPQRLVDNETVGELPVRRTGSGGGTEAGPTGAARGRRSPQPRLIAIAGGAVAAVAVTALALTQLGGGGEPDTSGGEDPPVTEGGGETEGPGPGEELIVVPKADAPLPEDTLLFTGLRNDQWEIWALDTDSGETRRLTSNVTGRTNLPALSPDRLSVLYTKEVAEGADRQLWVMRADGTGERMLFDGLASDARAAWSPDGRRIAVVIEEAGQVDLVVYSLDDGSQTPVTDSLEREGDPAWSADGRLAFWEAAPDGSNLWVVDVDDPAGSRRQLTSGPGEDADPAWSPDGTRLAFSRSLDGTSWSLFTIDADGGQPEQLTTPPRGAGDQDPAWSPDGERIAFESRGRPESEGRHLDIWVVDAVGGDPRPLTENPDLDAHPAWR